MNAPRPLRMRRTLALWALCLTTWGAAAEPQPVASEAAVKAAYLYRICSYVVWQPLVSSPETPLLMATLAAPELHEELRALVANRSIEGRPIVLRVLDANETLDTAGLLFIGRAAQLTAARWQQLTQTRGVLVITDRPNGLATGSAINFVEEEGRIRFEAAPGAAEQNGLKLSSRLLRVASRVLDEAR